MNETPRAVARVIVLEPVIESNGSDTRTAKARRPAKTGYG